MKRFLIIFFFYICITNVNANTITWIGSSSGNWNNTSNWSPASIPTNVDDVIFNTSVTVNMDNLSSMTYVINSLKITNNVTVELKRTQAGGGDRILQIKSTSTISKGLQIDAGSKLIIHGVNTKTTEPRGALHFYLDLCGDMGVTGEISGELKFTSNDNGGKKDDAQLQIYSGINNYADLIVKSGGKIIYTDSSGNTKSDASGTYLTMENGSQYIIEKNGGSIPAGGFWKPNSLVKVDNADGANGPQFLGSIYEDLDWNCPNQNIAVLNTNVSFNNVHLINTNASNDKYFGIKSGSSATSYTMTVNGNLMIDADAKFFITYSTVNSPDGGTLILKGNLINAGTFTTFGNSGTINDFILNGTSNQDITSSGTFDGDQLVLKMNNANGATLLSPISLKHELDLIDGVITTTSTNLLTLEDNATATGGSTSSFVYGPMKKIGDDDFTFPLGDGGIYAPIGISGGSGSATSDEFTAIYYRNNPQNVISNIVESGIDHISYVEYWDLIKNSGNASKIVTLDVHETSFAKLLNKTYVTRYDTTKWLKLSSTPGTSSSCGIYECGKTEINTATYNYGHFTFWTDQTFAMNPLPIKLIDFTVTKISSGVAAIHWELAECCAADASFVIEKSTDSRNFSAIGTVGGNPVSRLYQYEDNHLAKGISYYRLRMKDVDGSIQYSKIIAVVNGEKGIVINAIAPNPVVQTADISISAGQSGVLQFRLFDMLGHIVRQWQTAVSSGTNHVPLNAEGLSGGIYTVQVMGNDGMQTFRFVKQ